MSVTSRNPAGACAAIALAFLVAGCGHAPPASADTGARKAALAFSEAIVARDWEKAYDLVDAETRKRWNRAAFEHAAQAYRRLLGFDPDKARLKACEEQDGKAIAHVIFSAGSRSYRDGFLLRQSEGAWRISLPPSFGRNAS